MADINKSWKKIAILTMDSRVTNHCASENNNKLSKNDNLLLTNGLEDDIIRVVKGVHLVLQTKAESENLSRNLYRECRTT